MNAFNDVIIVNYNSTDCTINCIESIKKVNQCKELNIIVVDNDSKDSPSRILKKFPNTKLIRNRKNIGFAKAVNLAFKHTASELVLLLNPDTVVLSDFFISVHNFMRKNKDIAIVGTAIYETNGDLQGSARRFPSALTSLFGRKSPLTKWFPNNSFTRKEFACFNSNRRDAIDVDWVSGACMIIKKEAFEHIGGFDENLFLYWEDADLCKRLKDSGWRIVYYPKAIIRHFVGRSSNTRPLVSIFHFHHSCYKYFNKHVYGWRTILNPITFWGLSLRCALVMFLNMIRRRHKKRKSNYAKKTFLKGRRVKILRIISRLNVGGPAIHVALLTEGINTKYFESKVVAGSISKYEGDMDYLFKFLPKKESLISIPELQREISIKNDFISFMKLIKILFKEKPGIVHTHMSKAGALGRIAVCLMNMIMRSNIKIVHTYHGHVLEGYFSKAKSVFFALVEKILAQISDAIIAISKTQKWEISEKFRICKSQKVHTIPLGFDLSKFLNSREYKGWLREKINARGDEILIGIVGRLTAIKNHYMFIKAAKILADRYKTIPVKFVIIGDGELRQSLQKYVIEIGLKEKIIFYGWERNIQKIYPDLDILALTSMNEGTPVSIIEAMASGVPVITTGVGGIKDLLGTIDSDQNGCKGFILCERGILCAKDEPDELANGFEYMIRSRSDKNNQRIKNARSYVLKFYSKQNLIANIEDLYQRLLMAN